jgi:hypothetical protein
VLVVGAQASIIVDPGAASSIYDSLTDGNGATIADPASAASGLTMHVTFTPSAADIASAGTAINLLEIGGTSNGTGLYLLGGELHFLSKMNGSPGNTPSFDDLAFNSGNNMVSVKSTFGLLTAGTTYTVAAAYDPMTAKTLKLAIRKSGINTHVDSYVLTGVGTKTNWSGDDTVTNLNGDSSIGGGNSNSSNAFYDISIRDNDFAGSQGQGLLWNTSARILGQVALGWSAEGIADGSLPTWDTSIDVTGSAKSPFSWNGGGVKASGATNLAGVNDWVNSPAYTFSDKSWQDSLGDAETKQDATWEIVLRPGDFTGNHMIFNTGGNGDGTAFLLEGSVVSFRFQDNSTDPQRNFRTFDLATIGEATDFFHIVGTADVAGQSEGIGELFVNGVSVDGPVTSTGTIADWDGADTAGLGGGNFNIPGTTGYSADTFTGDIALFNYYSDQILTPELIMENYTALVPEPASAIMLLMGLGAVIRRRKK